jgi:ABC-type branched-subunit amino acid transport system substrate-binding protein
VRALNPSIDASRLHRALIFRTFRRLLFDIKRTGRLAFCFTASADGHYVRAPTSIHCEHFVHDEEGVAMSTNNGIEQPGRASLVSVALTAMAITANHVYTLGVSALVLGIFLLVVSASLFMWYRRTGRTAALVGYLLMNAWIVVGFGAIKGLWGITLPIFAGTFLSSVSPAYAKPVFGPFWFEISGVLMFIGSAFVLYHALEIGPTRHRVPLATAAAIAFALTVPAFAASSRDTWVPPAQGVVKIGVIVPTEGPYAMLGNSFVKAVEMAKDDLRDTKYRYELVIRDSGPDPAKARGVIQRVVQVDKVDAIVGGISLIGQVTKPQATAARIPHLCVCTVSWIGDGGYNFTNIPSPAAEAERWVQEAQRRKITRIALLTQEYPSINNHVKALKGEAARVGLAIADEQRFDGSVTDFRPMIARAERTHPDVYYVEATEPALDLLGQQLSDASLHNVSAVVAPSLSEKPELFEGAWYTDSNLRDVAFKQRFEKKYPGIRFATHMMPYAYDSVNMIVQAFERGQNPAVYLRNLRTYDGTAGTLTKQPGSGNFASAPAVWVIANGKPLLLNR